jgi:hypothetical protein
VAEDSSPARAIAAPGRPCVCRPRAGGARARASGPLRGGIASPRPSRVGATPRRRREPAALARRGRAEGASRARTEAGRAPECRWPGGRVIPKSSALSQHSIQSSAKSYKSNLALTGSVVSSTRSMHHRRGEAIGEAQWSLGWRWC